MSGFIKPLGNILSRFSLALLGALLVVTILLVLMAQMITTRQTVKETLQPYKVADIWPSQRRLTELVKPAKPKKIAPPEMLPQVQKVIPQIIPTQTVINRAAVRIQAPQPSASVAIGLGGGFARDTDFIPVYVPEPVYPRRALSRGREGYAVVEVVITTSGGVRNVTLLEESPRNYGFGSAALKAAAKLKYRPRMVDAQAVEVPGVRYKFSFRLE